MFRPPMPKGTTVHLPPIPTVHRPPAVDRALSIVRQRAQGGDVQGLGMPAPYASGDPGADAGPEMDSAGFDPGTGNEPPHAGPVIGPTGGREDAIPISVRSGSFVIPADVVAHLGGGNTLAGMRAIDAMLGGGNPAPGMRPIAGVAASMGGRVMGSGMPGQEETVPILVSDGEYVASPEQVTQAGGGDLDQGHRALDAFVRRRRAENIKKLQTLPGPVKG